MYEKEDGQPNFVIGEITKIDKDYTDYVAVKFTLLKMGKMMFVSCGI